MVQKVRQLFFWCCFLVSSLQWAQAPTTPSGAPVVASTYTFRYPLPPSPLLTSTASESVLLLPSNLPYPACAEPVIRWEGLFEEQKWGSLFNPTKQPSDFSQPFCGLPTQGAAFTLSGKDVILPCLAERLLQWAVQSIGR